MGDIKYYL